MIDFLKGKVSEVKENGVVLEVSGFGLFVKLSPSLLTQLKTGDVVSLKVELVIREENLTLYGFGGEEERELFKKIRRLAGFGDRLAFALVSELGIEKIRMAVQNNSITELLKVKGLGKKRAERLLVELKNEFSRKKVYEEVSSALKKLGFTKSEVDKVIENLPENLSQEDALKTALKLLSR